MSGLKLLFEKNNNEMSGFLCHRRSWSAMPPEILEGVSDRLPLADYMRFRGVCKNWRSSPSGRSELVNFPKDEQWLMFYELEKNKTGIPRCYIYSEHHPRCCTVRLCDLEGGPDATVVEEFKLGWLLVHRGRELLFLYNPLTFSRINLPKLNVSGDHSCTFTYLPTNSKCTVTVVRRASESSLRVSVCRVGDKRWGGQTIFDVSRNQIGRVIRITTCTHTHHQLCVQGCQTPTGIMVIHDPTKRNAVACNFFVKWQSWVHDHSIQDSPYLNYEMVNYIMGIKSKHGREWGQRSGGRGIEVKFWDAPFDSDQITSRASDEMAWLHSVKASFFEPKPVVFGRPSLLLERKKIRRRLPIPWFDFSLVVAAALSVLLNIERENGGRDEGRDLQ